ncbi:major facilitator superfamily domain-containing protein [Halenospora varia]|nr:major facilitator superfamily domain-containing protein [Halenospora varia]
MAAPSYHRYSASIYSQDSTYPPIYPYDYSSHENSNSSYPPSFPYANYPNHTNTTLPAYQEEPDVTRLLDEKVEKDVDLPILEGWPLALTVFSLCLALLLATLDTTIISTSLITIASDLGHFDKASWIVVAYLLTYSGFLIIFTRLSDIFGRKPVLLFAVTMFLAWSIGCGFAKTIEQIIIFRALQGIGGAGIYSLAYASILDVVPFRLVSAASGAISMSTACAGLLGPVLGGFITSNTTWRWVFWINIPCGVIVTISIILIFPATPGRQELGKQFKQIDWIGSFLSLAGSCLLIVSLEEGGVQFAWSSVAIIMMLVGSALCFTGFGIWETILTPRERQWKMLPLFPTRLVSHRVIAATLATVFFTGFPFVVTVISLPQRLQIVNNNTPAKSGMHMLPLILTTAFGAIVTGTVTSKYKIAWHLLVSANALMTLGCGLMSTLPVTERIDPLSYFYQSILGIGFGLTMASSMVVARTEVALKDNAVSLGAIAQLRQLGGVIGYAATQAVLNADFRSKLVGKLDPKQLSAVLLSTSNISRLSPANAIITREAFGNASNLQMRAVMIFSLLAFIASIFAWQSKPQDLAELEKERIANKEGTSRPASIISRNSTLKRRKAGAPGSLRRRPSAESADHSATASSGMQTQRSEPEWVHHATIASSRMPTRRPSTQSEGQMSFAPSAVSAMSRPISGHSFLSQQSASTLNSLGSIMVHQIPHSALFNQAELDAWMRR